MTTDSSDDIAAMKLRLAVKSGLILMGLMFAFGVFAGWSLAQWSRSSFGALAGLALMLGAGAWACSQYYSKQGLM